MAGTPHGAPRGRGIAMHGARSESEGAQTSMPETPSSESEASLRAAAAVEQAVETLDPLGAGEHPSASGLGAAVGRGVAWSLVATGVGKGLSFASQIVLAWHLSKGDFGVYAIAMSVASIAFAFRDGGLWNVLIARGAREYETIAGPIYWMGMVMAVVVGALLAGAAPVVAWAYGDPRLTWLIVIIALSWPLSATCWVMRAKLVVDLRFREFTACGIVAAVVRYGAMIAFAIAGFGPLSFVLPLLATAVADTLTAYWFTRERSWKRPPRLDLWRPLLSQSAWCIVGTLANAALDMGIYLVMGVFSAQTEVGLYFFAYQLVAQTGALLAANVQGVLLPAMSRIQDDGARHRRAALRSLRALMLVSAPASVALAVVFSPAETFIWNGKWAEAYWPVLALAAAYPLRAVFVVPQTLETSRGRFKRSALMTLVTGVGLMVAGGVAAMISPHATFVSMVGGAYLCIACTFWILRAFRGIGVSAGSALLATLPAWAIAIGSGACGAWSEHFLNIAGIAPLPRAIAAGGVFAIVFAVAARLLLHAAIVDLLRSLPLGLGPAIGRLVHIRWERMDKAGE